MHGQGSEFIGHEFRKLLIEEKYEMIANSSTLGNSTSNAILEQIHQVLVNLVHICNIKEAYVDEDDPWSLVLATESFEIHSTANGLKGYSTCELLFGRDMIILI